MSAEGSDKSGGCCSRWIDGRLLPPNGVAHNYTRVYSHIFCHQVTPIRMLEMGIGCMKVMGCTGSSVRGWASLLPTSTFVAGDIEPDAMITDCPRITTFLTDAEDSKVLESSIAHFDECMFDVAMDDGPHTLVSQVNFISSVAHRTRSLIVIEDVDLEHIDELHAYVAKCCPGWHCFQLRLPWPEGYRHPFERIMRMNNLIIAQNLASPLPGWHL